MHDECSGCGAKAQLWQVAQQRYCGSCCDVVQPRLLRRGDMLHLRAELRKAVGGLPCPRLLKLLSGYFPHDEWEEL